MSSNNYPDLSSVRRILIIKVMHLGDVLLTTPLISVLKTRFPKADIDVYIRKDALPILEDNPNISECIYCEHEWRKLPLWKRLFKEINMLRKIRAKKYDIVIQLTLGDRGGIAALASGARIRVGFDPQGYGMLGKKRFYTHLIPMPPQPRHCVEKHLDAARRIGIFSELNEREIFFHIPDKAKQRIRTLVGQDDFVLIHPVARWQFKHLAPEQIVAVIRALSQRGEKIVLSAGPDPQDMAYIETIVQQLPDLPLCNLAGKLNVKELAALITAAKALICVDSLPFHLASMFKIPVVVFFGPTCDKEWGPWRHPHAQVVNMPYACRPCLQEGCGGSQKSDCLLSLPLTKILAAYDRAIA